MPPALVRDRYPYPLPSLGAPLRVAFLGSASASGAHALHEAAHGLEPRFIELRPNAAPNLTDFAPHVVVALEPGLLAPGALREIAAARVAVVGATSTALATTDGAAGPPPLPAGFDRVIGTPGAQGVWRARPLPIDDRLYGEVTPSRRPPRTLFVGRSTDYREWMLTPAKHDHDLVHYTHGLTGEALAEQLRLADVGIALTADAGRGFPAQALLHLAAGHLLLTPRLEPGCGLEPGIDHLRLNARDDLLTILMQLRLHPDAYERMRVRGRLKAEQHRASRVWPRLVHDLVADLRVFGRSSGGSGARQPPSHTLDA